MEDINKQINDARELSSKLKQEQQKYWDSIRSIRDTIREGKASTGDKIKDFAIAISGSIDEEVLKVPSEVLAELDQGISRALSSNTPLIKIVQTEHKPYVFRENVGRGMFPPEDGTYPSRRYTLGLLNGQLNPNLDLKLASSIRLPFSRYVVSSDDSRENWTLRNEDFYLRFDNLMKADPATYTILRNKDTEIFYGKDVLETQSGRPFHSEKGLIKALIKLDLNLIGEELQKVMKDISNDLEEKLRNAVELEGVGKRENNAQYLKDAEERFKKLLPEAADYGLHTLILPGGIIINLTKLYKERNINPLG